jgi:hypothetical protein
MLEQERIKIKIKNEKKHKVDGQRDMLLTQHLRAQDALLQLLL